MDGGSTCHLTNHKADFIKGSFKPIQAQLFGIGSQGIEGKGKIALKSTKGITFIVDAFYVPDSPVRILSEGHFILLGLFLTGKQVGTDRYEKSLWRGDNLFFTASSRRPCSPKLLFVDASVVSHTQQSFLSTISAPIISADKSSHCLVSTVSRSTPAKCDICLLDFPSKNKLFSHLRQTHSVLTTIPQEVFSCLPESDLAKRCIFDWFGDKSFYPSFSPGPPVVTSTHQSPITLLSFSRRHSTASLAIWHARFGCLSKQGLLATSKCVQGMHITDKQDKCDCIVCRLGGMTKKSTKSALPPRSRADIVEVPVLADSSVTKPGEKLFADLQGPMPQTGPNGERFIATIICYKTRYGWSRNLKKKSEFTNFLISLCMMLLNRFGRHPRKFVADNAGELVEGQTRAFLDSIGCLICPTDRESPWQNIAEIFQRWYFRTARCLLIRAGVLRRNWVTAYPFAIYLRNRCFRDAIKCTSYEAFEGRQPQVGHIFPYGAFALVLKRDARLKADGKEADRAVLMRLNAITRDGSSYCFTDVETGGLYHSQHATWLEPQSPYLPGTKSAVPLDSIPLDPMEFPFGNDHEDLLHRHKRLTANDGHVPYSYVPPVPRSVPRASGPRRQSPSVARQPALPAVANINLDVLVQELTTQVQSLLQQQAVLRCPAVAPSASAAEAAVNPIQLSIPIPAPAGSPPGQNPDPLPIPIPIPVVRTFAQASPSVSAQPPAASTTNKKNVSSSTYTRCSNRTSKPAERFDEQVYLCSTSPPKSTVTSYTKSNNIVYAEDVATSMPSHFSGAVYMDCMPDHLCFTTKETGMFMPAGMDPFSHDVPDRVAMKGPHRESFMKAKQEEMDSLHEYHVWDLVDLPPGAVVLKGRWVLSVKTKEGKFERFKARWVVCGYIQRPGIDYFATYAPVAMTKTWRTFFAIIASRRWTTKLIDIRTAFLNALIDCLIFVQQPHGFAKRGHERKVCRLRKALYGTKQAPLLWYLELCGFLLEIGLTRSTHDPCCFFAMQGGELVLLLVVHADDIGMGYDGKSKTALTFVTAIKKKYRHRDHGEISWFLGMSVLRESDGSVLIHQKSYIEDMISKFKMDSAHTGRSLTPMDEHVRLSKSMPECKSGKPGQTRFKDFPYRELVGKMSYLSVWYRPDITFAYHTLSRFQRDTQNAHCTAANRLLRYLKSTKHFALRFKGGAPINLTAFADADFGEDVDTNRSHAGWILYLGGTPIYWKTVLVKLTALSTTEAEVNAAVLCAKDVIWFRNFLAELGYEQKEPTPIGEDNIGAFNISTSKKTHQRIKHNLINCAFLRDYANAGYVRLCHISTEDQDADILTKALGSTKHYRFTCKMLYDTVKHAPVSFLNYFGF